MSSSKTKSGIRTGIWTKAGTRHVVGIEVRFPDNSKATLRDIVRLKDIIQAVVDGWAKKHPKLFEGN